MNLNLTNLSAEPLHQQISRQIRERVLAGELPAGASLPSIRGLAALCRVSVITVQRAYDDLFREGIIESRRGKGFFVPALTSQDRLNSAQTRFRVRMADLVDSAIAEGLTEPDIRRLAGEAIANHTPKSGHAK